MKTIEKIRQKLSSSHFFNSKSKFDSSARRWRVNLTNLNEYLKYMNQEKVF